MSEKLIHQQYDGRHSAQYHILHVYCDVVIDHVRNTRERNVFTGVCHIVQMGEGWAR